MFLTPSATTARVAAILAPLLLTACASSEFEAVKAIGAAEVSSVRISEILVEVDTSRPNQELMRELKSNLRRATSVCATGTVPYRMEVRVLDFEDQNVGQSIMVGDAIELKGRVELTEVATDRSAGDYYIEQSFYWGGLIGAAMMSDAEKSLSREFASSVCEDVFGKSWDPEG